MDIRGNVGGHCLTIPMSISDLQPGASPTQALAGALALVREAAETLWSARSDEELIEVI